MKNFLTIAGGLALSLGVMSSNASALTHTLTLNATVQAGCTAGTPAGPGFVVSGSASTFTTAVTGTTQVPASGTLTFGSLVCTTSQVRVALTAARYGLFVDGTQSTAGAKKMNYMATAKLNNIQIAQLASVQGTGSTGQRALDATSNSLTIDISFPTAVSELLPAGNLTAGTYSDTITIAIEAAV